MSDTPETTMAEALAHFRHYGFPIAGAMPRTFVAIQVELSGLLDLTDGRMRKRLRVSEAGMLSDDWRHAPPVGAEGPTQAVGRAACEAGFEGLVARSAREPAGLNIVCFPDNLRAGSSSQILRADELS